MMKKPEDWWFEKERKLEKHIEWLRLKRPDILKEPINLLKILRECSDQRNKELKEAKEDWIREIKKKIVIVGDDKNDYVLKMTKNYYNHFFKRRGKI